MVSRVLARFTVFDLIIMALMACLGIAVKPLVVPLAHMITGPLFIPGGALAGGFYMLWLVLGAGIVGKLGAATVIALVQAIVILAIGFFGTHGAASLITYLLPGLAVDLVYWVIRHRGCCVMCCFLGGIAANVSGTLLVNLVFFRLPLIPLLLTSSTAALSGGLGGLLAWQLLVRLRRLQLLQQTTP